MSTSARIGSYWFITGLITVVLAIIGVFFLSRLPSSRQAIIKLADKNTIQMTPAPTPIPEAGLTILLMGRGGTGHAGGALSDTIVLARFFDTQKKALLLSIPRDLWVEIANPDLTTHWGKINSAYAVGGGKLSKSIVQMVTGIAIDKFITIDFSGFETAIDLIGGIDITVDRTFTDYEYPIEGREALDCSEYSVTPLDPAPTHIAQADLIAAGKLDATKLTGLSAQYPCRYELLHFETGRQHMDGKAALKFVRSRHSGEGGSDFARSRRQREVLFAVTEKLFSLNAVTKIPVFVSTLRSHIDTDITGQELLALLPKAAVYRGYQIVSHSLSSDNYLTQTLSADRQFILAPLAKQGEYTQIQNWLRSIIVPGTVLTTPTIEITVSQKNLGSAKQLQATLLHLRLPVFLGQVMIKPATTSATLIISNPSIDPEILSKIRSIATISADYVHTALPTTALKRDLRIILP